MFDLKIENFMLFTEYVTYFVLGYIIGDVQDKAYIDDNDFNIKIKSIISVISKNGKVWIGIWIFSTLFKIVLQYVSVVTYGVGSTLVLGDRIFTLLQAISIYCIFKTYFNGFHVGKMVKSISRCSFGIYLIHPFFINFLYKVLNVTPTNFLSIRVEAAIPILWFLVFIVSWGMSFVMLKVPVLKKFL